MEYEKKIKIVKMFLDKKRYDLLGEVVDENGMTWFVSLDNTDDCYEVSLVPWFEEDYMSDELFKDMAVKFIDANAQKIVEDFKMDLDRPIAFSYCELVGLANDRCIIKHHTYGKL